MNRPEGSRSASSLGCSDPISTAPSPNDGESGGVSGLDHAKDTEDSHPIEVEVPEEDSDVPPSTSAQQQQAASM